MRPRAYTVSSLAVAAVMLALPAASADLGWGLLESNGAVRLGGPAPAWEGTDLDGRKVTSDSFRGRPVLVDFSSIFCKSCQEAIAELARLDQAYRGTDLAILLVSADPAIPVATLRNYFLAAKAGYPVVRDPESSIAMAFGANLIPYQFVIGRDGTIRKIHVGFRPDLEAMLDLRREVQRKEATP